MQVTPGCYVGHTQQVRACGAQRRGSWIGHIQRRYFNDIIAIEAREFEDAKVLQVRRLRVGEQAEPLCSNHDMVCHFDENIESRLKRKAIVVRRQKSLRTVYMYIRTKGHTGPVHTGWTSLYVKSKRAPD
jgi:hypothetical protein